MSMAYYPDLSSGQALLQPTEDLTGESILLGIRPYYFGG